MQNQKMAVVVALFLSGKVLAEGDPIQVGQPAMKEHNGCCGRQSCGCKDKGPAPDLSPELQKILDEKTRAHQEKLAKEAQKQNTPGN